MVRFIVHTSVEHAWPADGLSPHCRSVVYSTKTGRSMALQSVNGSGAAWMLRHLAEVAGEEVLALDGPRMSRDLLEYLAKGDATTAVTGEMLLALEKETES